MQTRISFTTKFSFCLALLLASFQAAPLQAAPVSHPAASMAPFRIAQADNMWGPAIERLKPHPNQTSREQGYYIDPELVGKWGSVYVNHDLLMNYRVLYQYLDLNPDGTGTYTSIPLVLMQDMSVRLKKDETQQQEIFWGVLKAEDPEAGPFVAFDVQFVESKNLVTNLYLREPANDSQGKSFGVSYQENNQWKNDLWIDCQEYDKVFLNGAGLEATRNALVKFYQTKREADARAAMINEQNNNMLFNMMQTQHMSMMNAINNIR